jgi:hypothetical protein
VLCTIGVLTFLPRNITDENELLSGWRMFTKEKAMARATAHPDRQCISSEDIHGMEVYGPDGKNIGEMDHLILDKVSGRVAYAVTFDRPSRVANKRAFL